MWEIGETIGSREGRLDVGVAAAGILRDQFECLRFPAEKFQEVDLLFILAEVRLTMVSNR